MTDDPLRAGLDHPWHAARRAAVAIGPGLLLLALAVVAAFKLSPEGMEGLWSRVRWAPRALPRDASSRRW